MSKTGWAAQCERRRKEIDAEVRALEKERRHLDQLLALYRSENGQAAGRSSRSNRGESTSSKFLNEAARALMSGDGTSAFLELYRSAVAKMAEKPSLEAARSALIKSGYKYGIDYENADLVRLSEAEGEKKQ